MSNKLELQNNNIDLQGILTKVNTLPKKENIDEEVDTIENLTEQIKLALEGKAGGGGKIFAAIGVTYPEGSVCTCTNGTKTMEAKNTSGQWVFAIPEAGTWTVTATQGTNSKSQSVSITSEGQLESVTLSYRYYIFKEGSGAQNGFAFTATNPAVFSLTNNKIVFNTDTAQSNAIHVTPTISLKGYSTLNFELKCLNKQVTGWNITFGVGENAPTGNWNPGSWTASIADMYDTSRKTYSIDVSGVTDSQYVKLHTTTVTGEVYNIWLE